MPKPYRSSVQNEQCIRKTENAALENAGPQCSGEIRNGKMWHRIQRLTVYNRFNLRRNGYAIVSWRMTSR